MARNTNSADRQPMPTPVFQGTPSSPQAQCPLGAPWDMQLRQPVVVPVCTSVCVTCARVTFGRQPVVAWPGCSVGVGRIGLYTAAQKPCYPFIRDAQSISHWEIYAAAEKPRRSFIRWSCRAIHHLSQGNCRSNWPVTRCG